MDGVTMATLTSIATAIGTASTWFWARFSDFINMIATNDLILWPVIFAITAGSIGLVLKVIKRFGIKGRR